VGVGIGSAWWVNWSLEDVAEEPITVVATTWTWPTEPNGELTVQAVLGVHDAAMPTLVPKAKVVPPTKPDPSTVTLVLPAGTPLAGPIPVTVGAGQ
jgi:hypothetical protein